jgi:hypothetical protein
VKNPLIDWLIVVAAIATVAAKLPESLLAWRKYREERQKPDVTTKSSSPVQGTSRWAQMSAFERWFAISNLITFVLCGFALLALVFVAPSTPASSRDVVFVGVLVWMVIVCSRSSQ